MSVPSLIPASGTGQFYRKSAKIIRFVRMGCANRPFFHIVVTERRRDQYQPVIEQVGTYDPVPNQSNEQLVSFNFERIRHWMGKGVHLSTPVAQLLGLSGFLPIHPQTYMNAWRNRKHLAAQQTESSNEKDPESTPNQPEIKVGL